MKPADDTELERIRRDAHRVLQAMNNSPISAMDASFYQHYAEELRLIVEELLAIHPPKLHVEDVRVWLLWNCADPVGCFTTEAAAHEARADLQHRLQCEYGADTNLLETITVTTALLPLPLTTEGDRQR